MVVFDVAFKRETYFDGSFGVLVKVDFILTYLFFNLNVFRENKGRIQQNCKAFVFTFLMF